MLVLSPIELPNDEHVKHREPNTLAYLRNTQLGEGTVYISEDKYVPSHRALAPMPSNFFLLFVG